LEFQQDIPVYIVHGATISGKTAGRNENLTMISRILRR
jgi:hypothetical protein